MNKNRLKTKMSDDLETILYLDELSESEVWVPKGKLISYIKSTYLMEPKAYFDSVMKLRGLTNFDRCECGNYLNWNGIFSGYSNTCSVNCRNKLLSKGKSNIILVTNSFKITNLTNVEFLTKFYVPPGVVINFPSKLTLDALIDILTNSGCTWISGYNHKSIKYSPVSVRYHELNY